MTLFAAEHARLVEHLDRFQLAIEVKRISPAFRGSKTFYCDLCGYQPGKAIFWQTCAAIDHRDSYPNWTDLVICQDLDACAYRLSVRTS